MVGFLLSFSFPPKYTSQSLILVEPPDSPQSTEQSLPAPDLAQPISQLQDVLSDEELKSRIDRMALGKGVEQEMVDIRRHTRLTRVTLKVNDGSSDGKEDSNPSRSAKAFHVEYTASNPAEAQLICNAVTSILLQDNFKTPPEAGASSDNLQAMKRDLEEQNAKLAQFKKRHVGQLPGDVERNMSAFEDLHTRLNMLSKKIQTAQQNKADAESLLRRQSSDHQKSEKHDPPQRVDTARLEKQLSDLQSQLLQLQAQYTEDHPDVVKTKSEIASVEKQLADLKASNEARQSDAEAAQETPDIRQLRTRIQQDDQVIEETTPEKTRIQNQISLLQAKLVVEPDVESEYEQLLLDRDSAQKKYAVAMNNAAAEQATMVTSPQQLGRIRMLSPATVPRTPSFPNRLLFAISGWLGLAVVMRLALWITQPDSSQALNALSRPAKTLSSNA